MAITEIVLKAYELFEQQNMKVCSLLIIGGEILIYHKLKKNLSEFEKDNK